MTSNDEQKLAHWPDAKVVVAAYAGAESGYRAFESTLRRLRIALPGIRWWSLRPSASTRGGRSAAAPEHGSAGTNAAIEYPAPRIGDPYADAAERGAARRCVAALSALRADAAVVLSQAGHSPYTPAYLCYLAGIRHRAGFESEFAGAVLSRAIPPPRLSDDPARHTALLAELGLIEEASIPDEAPASPSTIRSRRCAG